MMMLRFTELLCRVQRSLNSRSFRGNKTQRMTPNAHVRRRSGTSKQQEKILFNQYGYLTFAFLLIAGSRVNAFQGHQVGGTRARARALRLRTSRASSMVLFGLFGDRNPRPRGSPNGSGISTKQEDGGASVVSSPPTLEWEVFVDQSKASLDRGGSATLDAFIGLAPSSVKVQPVILSKMKSKGPLVRCIALEGVNVGFDVANVDSVDKVCRILTRHMNVNVSRALMGIRLVPAPFSMCLIATCYLCRV